MGHELTHALDDQYVGLEDRAKPSTPATEDADVVDVLRHQEALVAAELDDEGRRRALVERVQSIYASQGLEVPASVVEHFTGAIRATQPERRIALAQGAHRFLFTWKNIHEWRRLLANFLSSWAGALLSWLGGDSPERSSFSGIARATLQLPGAMASRARPMICP